MATKEEELIHQRRAEAVIETIRSAGWKILEEEWGYIMGNQIESLILSEKENTPILKGQIRGMRNFLTVPDDVINKVKKEV